ncbi:MAG: hypothetical protein FWD55_07095 [Propionibacteriaceae bacterium]|nr:hypothetical protein [Propionibacteriaceae bacterium]
MTRRETILSRVLGPIAVAVTGVLVIGLAPTAFADDSQIIAERTADLIADVAPDVGDVVEPEQVGSQLIAEGDNVEVAIPINGDLPITIEATLEEGVVIPLQVTLPEEISVRDAKVADDGTIVFASDERHSAHAAVQVLEDGSVRMETVMVSPQGPSEFTYDFGDAIPVIQDDGSVDLVLAFDAEEFILEVIVGEIESPWAMDANGESVETYYVVNDEGQLVQIVEPAPGTKYPIVADPKVSASINGWSIDFNRAETKVAASSKAALIQKITDAGLTISGVILAWMNLSTASFVAGIASLYALYGGYTLQVASTAYAKGQCLRMNMGLFPLAGFVPVPIAYSGGNCK